MDDVLFKSGDKVILVDVNGNEPYLNSLNIKEGDIGIVTTFYKRQKICDVQFDNTTNNKIISLACRRFKLYEERRGRIKVNLLDDSLFEIY